MIVQEPELQLAELILNHHNKQLSCPACQTRHSSDGAFNRDQAGVGPDKKTYRKYRCKGKSKGLCSANLSVKAFVEQATSILTLPVVNQLRLELGLPIPVATSQHPTTAVPSARPTTPTPTIVQVAATPSQSGKRSNDYSVRTGYTPTAKRIYQAQSPAKSIVSDSQKETSSQWPSDGQSMSELFSRLSATEARLNMLEEKCAQQQLVIEHLLKDNRIMLLVIQLNDQSLSKNSVHRLRINRGLL
jgi:hypothetical protein